MLLQEEDLKIEEGRNRGNGESVVEDVKRVEVQGKSRKAVQNDMTLNLYDINGFQYQQDTYLHHCLIKNSR